MTIIHNILTNYLIYKHSYLLMYIYYKRCICVLSNEPEGLREAAKKFPPLLVRPLRKKNFFEAVEKKVSMTTLSSRGGG